MNDLSEPVEKTHEYEDIGVYSTIQEIDTPLENTEYLTPLQGTEYLTPVPAPVSHKLVPSVEFEYEVMDGYVETEGAGKLDSEQKVEEEDIYG